MLAVTQNLGAMVLPPKRVNYTVNRLYGVVSYVLIRETG